MLTGGWGGGGQEYFKKKRKKKYVFDRSSNKVSIRFRRERFRVRGEQNGGQP